MKTNELHNAIVENAIITFSVASKNLHVRFKFDTLYTLWK